MIRAVLFDMDGVLVDSEPVHAASVDDALRAFELPPLSAETYDRVFLGRTDWMGFSDYLEEIGRRDLDLTDLLRVKAAAFARRFPDEVQPQEDGLEVLRALAAEGYPLAIVSGALAAEIAMVVARFDLGSLVQAVVSGDEVPEGKPNPAPYLLGAERLGLAPEQCLVIEDAPAGVLAAKRAGMRCIAVDRLGEAALLAEAGADQVVERLSMAVVTPFLGGNELSGEA